MGERVERIRAMALIMSDQQWSVKRAVNTAYNNAAELLETGKYGLCSGDGNTNGYVDASDQPGTRRVQNGLSGYRSADANFDGCVNASGLSYHRCVNNARPRKCHETRVLASMEVLLAALHPAWQHLTKSPSNDTRKTHRIHPLFIGTT
jgi:hypothetical protein